MHFFPSIRAVVMVYRPALELSYKIILKNHCATHFISLTKIQLNGPFLEQMKLGFDEAVYLSMVSALPVETSGGAAP